MLKLYAYGRNAHLLSVGPVEPVIRRDRATYSHGALSEWWRILPMGFEQGFTLRRRPSGTGPLVLALEASLPPTDSKGTLGWGPIHYGKLRVSDARGREVPARLEVTRRQVRISVDDANATYPLVIDPLVWIELGKISASNGEAGDAFGQSVAISGTTLIVGSPNATVSGNAGQGAVYVFTRGSNGIWAQTAELTASDGAAGDHFGTSVAIQGQTIVIGAPNKTVGTNASEGAAYIFTFVSNAWQQSKILTPSDASEATWHVFGSSVAVDGSLIAVCAPYSGGYQSYYDGNVYTYVENGGIWSSSTILQSGVLEDGFGASVALSSNVLLVGAPGSESVLTFTYSSGTNQWSPGATIQGSSVDFGGSVFLSGNTALIGAPASTGKGAAYVFENSAGQWLQTGTLTSSDSVQGDLLGTALTLSGSAAVVGGPCATVNGDSCRGAVYIFTQSNGTWSMAAEVTAADGAANDHFGGSIASTGSTLAIGGNGVSVNGNSGQGAAYLDWWGDLSLTSTAATQIDRGQSFGYGVRILNQSMDPSPHLLASLTSTGTLISANADGGMCGTPDGGTVSCDLGPLVADGGTATASLAARADAAPRSTIEITTTLQNTHPALTSSAYTVVVGDPPVANDTAITTNPNSSVDAMLDASDPDGDALTFELVSQPQHGKTTLKDSTTGSYNYAPSADYKGTDSFTFKTNDGYAGSNTATVNILVDSIPSAKGGTLTTSENTPVNGTLSATDGDGDALTFDVVGPPRHGTVTVSPTPVGSISYVPAKGFTGNDAFTFEANDGLASSNVATISITVDPAGGSSTPPSARPPTNVSSGCGCAATKDAGSSVVLWALVLLALLARAAPLSGRALDD